MIASRSNVQDAGERRERGAMNSLEQVYDLAPRPGKYNRSPSSFLELEEVSVFILVSYIL